MTLAVTLERVAQIESMLSPIAPGATTASSDAMAASASAAPLATAASAPDSTAFASALESALSPNATTGAGSNALLGSGATPALQSQATTLGMTSPLGVVDPSDGAGYGASAMVRLAEGEVGQAEMPPGSNDSPRIATYRQATAGAANAVGPWCAYFVSWLARSAGEPLGAQGQGFGSVDQLYSWAQSAGRAVPNGQGYVPKPGDLIVFNEHVGMVESVLPNGQIQTIEGNSSDRVSRNVRGPNEAIGYVRMS